MGRCKGGSYGPSQVDRALLAVIRTGSPHRAAEELQEDPQDPLGVTFQTLSNWTKQGGRHYARYLELLEEHGPDIEREAVNNARSLAVLMAEKERQLVQAIDPNALEPKEIAGALRNVSTSKALQADKIILPLTGRNLTPAPSAGFDQVTEALAKLGITIGVKPQHVDSTATDTHALPATTDTTGN